MFGEYVCVITGYISFLTFIIRMVLMLTLVIDCFCNVFMPFYYPKRCKKIMLSLTLAAWSLTIFVSIVMLPGLNMTVTNLCRDVNPRHIRPDI